MYQFSKREKALLCVLAALAGTAAPGKACLVPSLENRQILEMELETVLEEQQVMSRFIGQADVWKKERDTQENLAEEKGRIFYELADPETVGERLAVLLEECGLRIREISVSVEPLEESGAAMEDAGETRSADSGRGELFCGSITGEAEGNCKAVMDFLDQTAESPAMKMEELFLTEDEDGAYRFEFTVSVYMIGQPRER